jgi:hypothetical protein
MDGTVRLKKVTFTDVCGSGAEKTIVKHNKKHPNKMAKDNKVSL